jgi:hypothetical protein
LFAIAEQAFLAKKKGKEDMVFVDVWTSSQMQDKKNQLVLSQNKLDSLFWHYKKNKLKPALMPFTFKHWVKKLERKEALLIIANLQLTKVRGIWEYSQWSHKCTQQPWWFGIITCHL